MIRLRTIFAAVLISGFFLGNQSQAAPKFKVPLTLKLVYTSSYDDNILNYSERDITRFQDSQQPYPPPITTADDWINSLGVRLYRDFRLGRGFSLRPYYAGKTAIYAINPTKSWQSHNILARLSYRSRAYLTLKYLYLPSYFLRVYYDKDTQAYHGDPQAYHGADFTLSRPSAALRLRWEPYEVEIEGGRDYEYYNSYFTEYDVEADFIGATGTYSGFPNLDVSLGYTYKNADNVGFGQQIPSPIDPTMDTEYGDGSYQEDQFSVSLGYQLPRIKKTFYWKAGLNLKRCYRYYQSQLPVEQDPFHAGRRDRRDTIEPSLLFSPTSELDFQVSFIYDLRRTQSPDPNVPTIKNFDNRTIELTIVYQVF
jgi:hypothetical protein